MFGNVERLHVVDTLVVQFARRSDRVKSATLKLGCQFRVDLQARNAMTSVSQRICEQPEAGTEVEDVAASGSVALDQIDEKRIVPLGQSHRFEVILARITEGVCRHCIVRSQVWAR